MPLCDCGALTARYTVHMETPDGRPLKQAFTTCPSCHPEEFAEPFVDPSNNKIWAGHEAMPNLYTQDADGTYRAKDELISDTVANISKPANWDQIERKRATRRTQPMSPEEIRRTREWGEKYARPTLTRLNQGL